MTNTHRTADITRKTASRVIAACFVTFLFSGVLMFAIQPALSPATDDALAIPDGALNFGSVVAQRGFRWTLPVRNTTQHDIHVQNVVLACRCMAIEPREFTVAGGQTVTVCVILDLLPPTKADARRTSRVVGLDFVPVTTETLPHPVHWRLRGIVLRHPLLVEESPVEFPGPLVEGCPSPPKCVEITAMTGLVGVKATGAESTLAVDVRHSASELDKYEIRITPRQSLCAGEYHCELLLQAYPVGLARDLFPDLPLDVYLDVRHDVVATPRTLFLGKGIVGSTSRIP